MSRKQSTVERIRKKKAGASTPAVENYSRDPFHNGQTPSCRLLLDAVQDIFPELQQQMQQKMPSSELGQLLRWQLLKRRKERSFPPAPPLLLSSPSSSTSVKGPLQNGGDTPPGPSSAKKKRKKKKKKKDSSSIDLTASKSDESDKEEENEITTTEKPNGSAQLNSKDDRALSPAELTSSDVEIGSLKDGSGNHDFDLSVRSLDRSVHDLEEHRNMLETTETPTLQALPSDDAMITNIGRVGHSSVVFFEQIQQEMTEREDSEEFDIPIAVETPSEPMGTPPSHHNRPKLRSRTLSNSSVGSLDGVVTPTTKNTASESDAMNAPIGSPITHEWVPEEGASAKTETPPGDVIKNPLELPFLLRLCTDNGLTTTTIDGSLISAERTDADEHRPSSLETTKILMEEWMGNLLDQGGANAFALDETQRREKEYNSFLNFVQSKLRNGSQPLGIPLALLEDTINSIECSTCQQDAIAVVSTWSERAEDKALVLNPIVLQDRTSKSADDVDAAFDYVALEEGHHLPKAKPMDEEDGVDVDLKTHMSYHVSEPKIKKSGTKHLFIDEITPKHLNSLVESWLPCGIEEEILVATDVDNRLGEAPRNPRHEVLDHEQVAKLQTRILERTSNIESDINEMTLLGKETVEFFQKTKELEEESHLNVEYKSFPQMKKTEQALTMYRDKIYAVIKSIAQDRSDALVDLRLEVWVLFLDTLSSTLKSCDKFYERVGEEVADQRGVLPKMFVHAGFRKLFFELLDIQVRKWTSLGQRIRELLNRRLLKELCTRTVWHEDRSPPADQKSLDLDEKCLELLKELVDWAEMIICARMGEIQRERMGQTERMLEQLQSVVEPLAAEYAKVEKYFPAERNHYFASLRSNIVLAQGVKKRMRLIDNAEVEHMTTGVILMWTHARLMQNRTINAVDIPSLPLQLKRWMLQDDSNVMEDWSGNNGIASPLNTYHQRYCQAGRQGKRRAMCVLAGLTYRWLEQQCKAWKAEMAEKELLTGFDHDESSVSASNSKDNLGVVKSTKAKKNNKKKKIKNSAVLYTDDSSSRFDDSSLGASSNSINDLNGHVDKPAEQEPPMGDEDKKQTDRDAIKEEEIGLPGTEPAPEDVSNPTVTEKTPPPVEMPDSSTDESVHSTASQDHAKGTTEDEIELEVFPSQIFVEDGNRKISAEEYLVAKIRLVMFTKSKNERVVVIS